MSLIKEDIVLILICFFPQLPFLGFCTFTGLFNLTQHTARDLKLASFVASGIKEIQGHTPSARCALFGAQCLRRKLYCDCVSENTQLYTLILKI